MFNFYKKLGKKTTLAIIVVIVGFIGYMLYRRRSEGFNDLDVRRKMPEGHREMVLFTMTGCSHCEALKPQWELLKNNYNNNSYFELKEVVVPERNDLAKKYGVTAFPTILGMKNGKQVAKYAGDRSYQSLKHFADKDVIGS